MKLIKKELRLNPNSPGDAKIISFLNKCGHKQSEIIKACLIRMADIIPIESSKDSTMVLRLIQMISLGSASHSGTGIGTGTPSKVRAKRKGYTKPVKEKTADTKPVSTPEPLNNPKEIIMSDEDVMSELGTKKSFLATDDEEREIFKMMLASDPDLDRGSED